ncbi:pilus assembly PilX family protein [Roseateles albus]|uniref:Type 4 fimbrial biogenesis protein PilX N-terminal domain-containing protein n=1 Tax=Roseateles albus TaxID=2987525 RepID=A0ABT5KG74_9BURK|nr:PilX N-terminal domain-containing pilus assembly protein [Roseateles albus]MDC8772933.1 hypothetical protein [Roseateles albus]
MTAQTCRDERGAATLVVVMVLFLIMAMMAAYASRNVIFEQRIASSYYRAGVSLEAAEAGAEWTLGMLNGLKIDQACLASNSATDRFRDRYLTISSTSRDILPAAIVSTPGTATRKIVADCVRTEAQEGWACNCPTGTWSAAAAPASAGNMQPSFKVSLISPVANRAGNLRIESAGCTSSIAQNCDADAMSSDMALARSVVQLDAALLSALKVPPATALTVKGSINLGTNGIGLHNSEAISNGLLLLTSDDAVPNLLETRLDSLPGTPVQQGLIFADPVLASASPEQMFKMFFGMSLKRYVNQPAMRQVTCSGDCGPALAAAYAKGTRLAWVRGSLDILSATVLGSATSPMLIIAEGPVRIDAGLELTGLLYARGNTIWTNSSGQPALLKGAMLVDGDLTVDGTVDIWYQTSVMDELKNRAGSFVRVQGSWWN